MLHKTLAILKENKSVFAVCIASELLRTSSSTSELTQKIRLLIQPIKFCAYQNQESKTGSGVLTYLFTFLISIDTPTV